MEFGVLFTSHPHPEEEPYPHRDVHARSTDEIVEAERLGYDTAWIAEHHFATSYGIMPDCFAYMAYLAAKTSRIKIGAAVITLPLYDPIRVVENTAFVDILSNGRVRLGVGSGYRPYEFEGLGKDFENRRDMVEEAIGLSLQEPDEGETPAVDSDDEDYETEDKGIDYRFLDPDEDGILAPFGKSKAAAAPPRVGGPDRERLERVMADLVACRKLLDNALKDG